MANLRRGKGIGLAALSLLLLIAPTASSAQQRPPIVEQMAKVYGLDAFGQIEAIRYTFNAERPGVNVARSWEWHPKSGTISYQGKDKQGKPVSSTYQESQLATQSDIVKNVINPAFINDQYWLLLPLHAAWDGSATVTDEGMQKLPTGTGSAQRIVLKYPSQGGYAPGDTWELYVGADKRVVAFIYRRGKTDKPGVLVQTWADEKRVGPLLIATDHHGTASDGKPLRVFLSAVAVKVTGSADWINAQ